MDEMAKQAQLLGLADMNRIREFTEIFIKENNIDKLYQPNLLNEFSEIIRDFNSSYLNLLDIFTDYKLNKIEDVFEEDLMQDDRVRISVRRYLKRLTMLSSMNNCIVKNYEAHSEFIKSLVINFDLLHIPWINYPRELNYSSKSTEEFDIELTLLMEMLKDQKGITKLALDLDELSERTSFRVVELLIAINKLKTKRVIFNFEQRKHLVTIWIRKEPS